MIKSFSNAIKYIEQYIPTPDKKHPGELGLARMKYLMELLGNPQLKYPTIHVGGTSGKGSTATFIASILATKYKVGLHTSPHLVSITERIVIYGSGETFFGDVRQPNSRFRNLSSSSLSESLLPEQSKHSSLNLKQTFNAPQKAHPSPYYISDRDFTDLVNYLIPYVKKVENSNLGGPSYFEIVTAMAFLYFFQKKVDITVIEVGMGGRYDATNVIKPQVAVITNVELDHTEILGDTVEKIAEDKVGIIKSGIEVISGVKKKSVIRILRSKIKDQRSKLSLLNRDFSYKVKKIDANGSVFDYKGDKLFRSLKSLKLRLLGEHQVENAALAVRAIEQLAISNWQLAIRDIRLGLLNAFIPGRLEIIRRRPLVILDGAHNPDKVRALVSSIKKIFPKKKITTIIAIKNDKNAEEMLSLLLKISHRVILTKFQLKGDVGIISSYSPEELVKKSNLISRQHRYTSRHTKVVRKILVVPEVKKALEEEIRLAKPEDLILVTGSLYLVGEIKKYSNMQINK